ncbi:hypothetical protein GX51_05438 [Blastomyces parvus]|uniref:J domain-containing protein n=1 Tax=Blastomyces parvus TaxID=2060905 RepID=A0A2B7WX85_9EURO|nr:hypothetical protein GX51_05438 [Blastomyces parvus]
MPEANQESGSGDRSSGSENDYDRLKDYPDDIDYYSLLALARDPPPTESQIRSAYRTLTLSFHPDKQPKELREAATAHYNRIRDAYETLIDPKKRAVYDMLGKEGVRHTWAEGGLMGRNGYAERQQVGVKAMDEAEFRQWFLAVMRRKERKFLNDLVDANGTVHISVDATSMFETTPDGDISIRLPSLTPSGFLLGYSLPIPLPNIPWFSASKSETNGTDDDDTDKPSTAQETFEHQAPQTTRLQLQATVNGRFGKPVQTVKVFVPSTGEKFERQVRQPLTIRNANVNFGATLTHVINKDPPKRGILKGPLLSFLGGAVVNVTTLIIPQPLVQASITKPVTLVEGTQPFSITVKSSCVSSPLRYPPELNLSITRMIGTGGVVTGNWSSGPLSWPEFLQNMFMDVSKLDPYAEALRPYASMSGVSIGYTSLPRMQLPTDDHDDDHDMEDDDADMFSDHANNSPKQLEQPPKPNEIWGFSLGSSPEGMNLTVRYERTIFARKPAEPLRSEWSGEGYYPSKSRSGSGAVRLGVRAVIDPSLNLGWSVYGSRRVGEFTRMGLTISTVGNMGLGCSISWSRLGQTFKMPIALCPVDKLTGDLCTLAVIVPFTVYTAIEFGYLRPRARRRENQEIARMRKRLSKRVAKRKAESAQAISMMRDQVLRRQDREADRDGLVIVHAEYGCPPSRSSKKNKQNGHTVVDDDYAEGMIDVTIPVAALVDQGQLNISPRVIKSQILGFYDPFPLRPKLLRVRYRFAGTEHMAEAWDSEGLTCPMKSHLL